MLSRFRPSNSAKKLKDQTKSSQKPLKAKGNEAGSRSALPASEMERGPEVTLLSPFSFDGNSNFDKIPPHLIKEFPDIYAVPAAVEAQGKTDSPFCVWSAQAEGIMRSFLERDIPHAVSIRAASSYPNAILNTMFELPRTGHPVGILLLPLLVLMEPSLC